VEWGEPRDTGGAREGQASVNSHFRISNGAGRGGPARAIYQIYRQTRNPQQPWPRAEQSQARNAWAHGGFFREGGRSGISLWLRPAPSPGSSYDHRNTRRKMANCGVLAELPIGILICNTSHRRLAAGSESRLAPMPVAVTGLRILDLCACGCGAAVEAGGGNMPRPSCGIGLGSGQLPWPGGGG